MWSHAVLGIACQCECRVRGAGAGCKGRRLGVPGTPSKSHTAEHVEDQSILSAPEATAWRCLLSDVAGLGTSMQPQANCVLGISMHSNR